MRCEPSQPVTAVEESIEDDEPSHPVDWRRIGRRSDCWMDEIREEEEAQLQVVRERGRPCVMVFSNMRMNIFAISKLLVHDLMCAHYKMTEWGYLY